jgi:hypothetical protein
MAVATITATAISSTRTKWDMLRSASGMAHSIMGPMTEQKLVIPLGITTASWGRPPSPSTDHWAQVVAGGSEEVLANFGR